MNMKDEKSAVVDSNSVSDAKHESGGNGLPVPGTQRFLKRFQACNPELYDFNAKEFTVIAQNGNSYTVRFPCGTLAIAAECEVVDLDANALYALLSDAHELKEMKVEMNGDYSRDDIAALSPPGSVPSALFSIMPLY